MCVNVCVSRLRGFMRISLRVGVGGCARAFAGDCWEICMNMCTHVWVSLLKSDAPWAHNHHSSSQRFEHGVAESSQRQLEREWAWAQVCALMFVTVCYHLSVTACVLVLCLSVWEWFVSHKGNMSQQIGRGFVVSYHLSPALKKMISLYWRLHQLLLQSESHAT